MLALSALPALLGPDLLGVAGSWPPLLPPLFGVFQRSRCSCFWPGLIVRARACSKPFTRFGLFVAHVPLSEQLQLAVQLASLASLEDVVAHGIQSLLDSPSILPVSL